MGDQTSASATITDSTVRMRLKRFDKTFKPYKKKLVLYYGQDFAQRTLEQARIEYELLLPRTPVFEGRINFFNWVMGVNAVIVSLYKAMKANEKTSEETVPFHDNGGVRRAATAARRRLYSRTVSTVGSA